MCAIQPIKHPHTPATSHDAVYGGRIQKYKQKMVNANFKHWSRNFANCSVDSVKDPVFNGEFRIIFHNGATTKVIDLSLLDELFLHTLHGLPRQDFDLLIEITLKEILRNTNSGANWPQESIARQEHHDNAAFAQKVWEIIDCFAEHFDIHKDPFTNDMRQDHSDLDAILENLEALCLSCGRFDCKTAVNDTQSGCVAVSKPEAHPVKPKKKLSIRLKPAPKKKKVSLTIRDRARPKIASAMEKIDTIAEEPK